MIILPSLKVDGNRCLKIAIQASLGVLGMVVATAVLFFYCYPWDQREMQPSLSAEKNKKQALSFTYESIGMGGLTLHPRHALGWVSRIADELALIAYNSRPDVDSRVAKLLLNLKNGKEQWTQLNGVPFFLNEAQHGKGLTISQTETKLWIKPILLDNGTVLVEAGRKLSVQEGETVEEKGQFYLTSQGGVPTRYNPAQNLFIQQLKAAHFFSQDLLIQKYGGNEYASWREKGILELMSASQSYACFISTGDYLAYENAEWRVTSFNGLKAELPVARVKSLSAQAIELDVWDETGFCPIAIKLDVEKTGRIQSKTETAPVKVRLRSATQISCAIGKKRMLLRQGDWVLKTASGWRQLRRADEIERFLQHRLKGELLIFDKIEKDQGRLVMKGHLFDETRTQVHPLSLPIEGDNLKPKAGRKKIAQNQMRKAK